MRFTSIFSTAVLASLAFVDGVLGAKLHVVHAGAKAHAGREIAKRDSGAHQLAKRFSNARFSFFATGLGACGHFNNPGDFIVALNHQQYDEGGHCGETITISYGGKSTTATIMDRCEECPFGALDFTTGLFDFFGPESAGYLYGTWNYGAGDPEPKPTPKPTPKPSPSTTWKPTTTSTTKHTTSTHSTTSTTSTTSTSTSTSSTPTPTATGVLVDFNQIALTLANVALAAGAVNA